MVSGAKVSRAVNGERPRAATTPSATTTHAIAPARAMRARDAATDDPADDARHRARSRVGRCGDARGARGLRTGAHAI